MQGNSYDETVMDKHALATPSNHETVIQMILFRTWIQWAPSDCGWWRHAFCTVIEARKKLSTRKQTRIHNFATVLELVLMNLVVSMITLGHS